MGPLVGLKVIEGVTVKLAEAELTPSLAKTALTPAVSVKLKLKVAVKLPNAFALTVEGLVAMGVPSKLIVIFELSIKFEPVTVTYVPTGPLIGLTVMLEEVTLERGIFIIKTAVDDGYCIVACR